MGNCDQKAFVDDSIAQRQFSPSGDTPTTDTMEKDPNEELDNMMSRPFAFKKEKSAVDPLCTYIRNAIPKAILSIETAKFTNKYRIKKNIKCEDNILYQVNIVEQKSTGAFFLAKMITKERIKKIGDEQFKILFLNEIRALSQTKHPNIEQLKEVYLLSYKNNFKLILITNKVEAKSLLDIINERVSQQKQFTYKEIGIFAKTLIETLGYLKSQNIIHRNLSPENIFFTKENDFSSLSIRNFYFCAILGRVQTATGIYGGLWYMAPEMLRDLKYDYKLDIWSVGLTLYIMTTMENPFSNCETRDMILDKLKHKRAFREREELKKYGVNMEILNFISKMLAENPQLRTSSELLQEDDYIKNIAIEERRKEEEDKKLEDEIKKETQM